MHRVGKLNLLDIDPIDHRCSPHTEASKLSSSANQLTEFYMREILVVYGLNGSSFGDLIITLNALST